MAKRIGDAVEAEVHVQRALRQKFEERRLYNRALKKDQDGEGEKVAENTAQEVVTKEEENETKADDKSDGVIEKIDPWMYGGSHLERFIEEANRYDPGKKSRLRVSTANRRALAILNSDEEWTDAEKIKLGAALVKILLEKAEIQIPGEGRREPAFTHELRWIGFTTRHQPMVLPPRDWVGPDDGAYSALKTELMRTHGCQIQK
eukprot:6749918-Ditylum_brightwellii.AAC.1